MDGFSRGPTGLLVCHCVLIEADDGLVLVDTGFGMRDVLRPYERLSPLFIHLNRIQFDPEHTALGQVERLGFDARDVRHIVLTHLDFDHAGGLEDFPEATVHVMEAEAEAARRREGFIARRRYRPEQWNDVRRWRFYDRDGSRWHGFEAVRDLEGLPPEILMIPLPGHTEGHAGVAIETTEGWFLNAGDTYFNRHEMDRPERRCPPRGAGLPAHDGGGSRPPPAQPGPGAPPRPGPPGRGEGVLQPRRRGVRGPAASRDGARPPDGRREPARRGQIRRSDPVTHGRRRFETRPPGVGPETAII
jgi:glyoxylase-like metal-dependent hydrolase (beta-lactamase superfamily II)